MAKFYGAVGYNNGNVETAPGVWNESMIEKNYFGDVIRSTRKMDPGEKVNSDISVQNSISIVADAYAGEHINAIRYIRWMGGLWTVTSVEVQAPRLILRLGEVYNGQTA